MRVESIDRRGFTLVEVLVATLVTLMIVGGLTVMFGDLTEQVADSRALTALQDGLRHTKDLISSDLKGTTAPTAPPLDPAANLGYFETIEGPIGPVFYPVTKALDPNNPLAQNNTFTFPLNDATLPTTLNGLTLAGGELLTEDTTLGDVDDILMFTTRSQDDAFVGTGFPTSTLTSPRAEVIWFLRGRTLYRRVLLIRPLGSNLGGTPYNYSSIPVSLRMGEFRSPGSLFANRRFYPVGNSLGDLTKRENRFGHQPSSFPHDARFWMRISPSVAPGSSGSASTLPWVIARPGFMMPTVAETDAGYGSALSWPFPAEWAFADANGISPYVLNYSQYAGANGGMFGNANQTSAQIVVPKQYYRGVLLSDVNQGRAGESIYLPTHVDTRNGARRVFDPWSRRPLELDPIDYFGTGSMFASSFSQANIDKNFSGTAEDKRNVHKGGLGAVDFEGMRSYADAPRYDDVLMSNVLSFDVKLWDPGAPLFTIRRSTGGGAATAQPVDMNEVTILPHDPAYKQVLAQFIRTPGAATQPTGFGAYVDMNYMWGASVYSKLRKLTTSGDNGYFDALETLEVSLGLPTGSLPRPSFAGPGQTSAGYGYYTMNNWQDFQGAPSATYRPNPRAGDLAGALHEAWAGAGQTQTTCTNLTRCGLASVYCTWSTHYEQNGLDDDQDGIIDNYTNGLDDPGSDPGVDDPSERETVPPYPAALRGIQVTIRAFDPDTKQIREVKITHEFLLE
jgi:type II secretory pathway component PulJ